MRIAIATDWFPPRRGGIESQLQQLAQRLAARGHDVTVITSTPGDPASGRVAVRRLAVARLPGAGIAASPALPRALRRELDAGFDVVHGHVSVVSPVGWLAALSARAAGLPTVVTFHSVLRGKRIALAALNALFHLDESHVTWTAVSALVASQARAALPGTDVAVLPNGVDLGFWRTGARARGAVSPVTFVCAMRLHRKKRPRQLLRAFLAAARGAATPARLVFAGEGPELRAMRDDLGMAGIPGHAAVEFRGWLSPEALRALYASADAFVLPTRHEAFGLAALEARAAGLPVVAMRAAGCGEFLRDGTNALLCDDDPGLERALTHVIGDAALRARLAACDGALDRYDWPAVLAAHERVYATAATRSGTVAAGAPRSR